MSDDKLCEIIVTFRYLGVMKDESLLAMEELYKRRLNGSQFKYEQTIDELLSQLPKIDIDINKLLKKFKL